MAGAAVTPADSVATADSAKAQETCSELVARVRKSDCVKPVARYLNLNGANFSVGLAFSTGFLSIASNGSDAATLVGIFSPAPYYGFSLPNSFFGGSRWGYEFSFLYSSTVATYQPVPMASNDVRDVGTYASMTFVSVSPSVFLSLGARDEDPDTFARIGLGLGAGWAWVRGTAYFLEDSSGANHACYDAARVFDAGTIGKRELRSACDLRTYKQSSPGLSGRFFLDTRWHWLYASWSTETVQFTSGEYDYTPFEMSVKLAWIHDL